MARNESWKDTDHSDSGASAVMPRNASARLASAAPGRPSHVAASAQPLATTERTTGASAPASST
ncbi:MAG: hypothetical protein IPK07_21220 [Deltaproteobacteria bacterium]|nr:hypothetical protein [Deltaproteobacteria bacterium]